MKKYNSIKNNNYTFMNDSTIARFQTPHHPRPFVVATIE